MIKRFNKLTGMVGQRLAREYLQAKGWEFVVENFATRFGEIDLIFKQNDTWVFVEVKTKRGDRFGLPEEMINRNKIGRIKRMATVFLQGREEKCRIDVVAVELLENEQMSQIRHYENVS